MLDKFGLSMDHQRALVKQRLAEHGLTIRQWAVAKGYSESLVYAVLSGKNHASRGESFRIAVELGLKVMPPPAEAPQYVRDVLQKTSEPALVRGEQS